MVASVCGFVTLLCSVAVASIRASHAEYPDRYIVSCKGSDDPVDDV